MFDEIFNNTKEKEKSIDENELTNEQNNIISLILKNNKIINDYEIINNTNQSDSKYSTRGYYIEKMNNTDAVVVTIAMGMKKNRGYSIRIKYIDIYHYSEYVIIYVEETSPNDGERVPDVITYPCAKIKFDKKPNSLDIINAETSEIFEEVEMWYYMDLRLLLLIILWAL